MRGFVVTIISVALATILFTLTSTLYDNFSSMQRALVEPHALTYSAFIFDGVGHDLTGITGNSIRLGQENGSVSLLVGCRVPNKNFTGELGEYENFIEGNFADRVNAIIDANFSNMTRGTLEMEISGYEYENRYDGGEMYFGGTGALEYVINASVYKNRGNLTQMNSSGGDLNVSIRYTDLNGSIVQSVTIKSNETNVFRADYGTSEYMEIRVGRNRGQDGTVLILTENADADVRWSAVLPEPTGRVGYSFDATMFYSQGGISKNTKISK